VSALLRQSEIFRPRKQSYVGSQAFKSGGEIENDLHSSKIVATNGAKSVDAAQSANGVPIKVVTVICIGRRREKVMFTINQNRAATDVYQSGGRVNGVNGVSRRFEQLNFARSHLCDRHNKPFYLIAIGSTRACAINY
jgi:hypothetical protein